MDQKSIVDDLPDLSFPLSAAVTLGRYDEVTLERELPVPMDIDRLVSNAPAVGTFVVTSFFSNDEELLALQADDLALHRPGSSVAAPYRPHAAPTTKVKMRIQSTGHLPPGAKSGMPFMLVVHVCGRRARPR